jgi:drug/metabolite transporter (DMT)-like permease
MKTELRKGYIALAIVSFFWGTTYIASRIGVEYMPGIFLSGVRQFSSGVMLVSFFLLKGYKLPARNELKKISFQGVILLCIANGSLSWSLQYISIGLAAIIVALVPLFIALFSIWLSECATISRWMLVGLLIGFFGVLTIFYDYLDLFRNTSFLTGIALAFISTLAWSFGTVYTTKQKTSIPVLFNVGLQMLAGGSVMLVLCFASGQYINLVHAANSAWYALLYLIFFGSLLAYSAYVIAFTKLPSTLASVYAYINPLVAVVFGWLLLQEKMNVHMIFGTLITLGGVFLVKREFKKQPIVKQ